jgi:hypothetical protein
MRTYIAALLFAISSVYASGSFAQDYKWYLNAVSNVFYDSPAAVCASYPTTTNGDGTTFTPAGPQYLRDGWFYCTERVVQTNGNTNVGVYNGYAAVRVGDSCPAGGIYHPDTGECDIPPCPVGQIRDTMTGLCIVPPTDCKAKIGQSHSLWLHSFDFEMCVSGCSLAITSAQPVKRLVDEGVDYDVQGEYTGETCTANTPIDETCGDNCQMSPPTESSTDTQCTATVTDAEGRQQSNCQTTDTMKDIQACVSKGGSLGQINGMLDCVAANKGPKASLTTKDVKQTTETKADGGTKTTTETTTTVKNCVGTKACTTTSTTVTNVSNTNANGTNGGESSSCKGDNCGSGGKESTTPGESEEKEEEGVAGPTKSLVKIDSVGFGQTGKEWEDKIAAGRQQLDGLIDQYSNLFSGAFDLNIGTGGGALPCYKIPVNALKINTTLDFCPAKFEDQLIYLKYILLACATILAGFFILRD